MDWFDFMGWSDRDKMDTRVDPTRSTDTHQPTDAPPRPPQYDPAELVGILSRYAMRDLVRETGVPRQTLYDIINGASPTRATYERLQPGLAVCRRERVFPRDSPLGGHFEAETQAAGAILPAHSAINEVSQLLSDRLLARLKQARREIPAYMRAQPLGRPRRTSTH